MALNFEKFKKMSDQKWTTLLQLERDIAKVEGKIEAGQENVDDFERYVTYICNFLNFAFWSKNAVSKKLAIFLGYVLTKPS